MKKYVVAIVGPTAVGKTKHSIALAQAIGGEIISGDSMQVYRGMDIGTAKITPDEAAGVPHHLIDIQNPSAGYSGAQFKAMAQQSIADLFARQRTPIIVGGTGLYINSLLYNYQYANANTDTTYRQTLLAVVADHGLARLYAQLQEVDPAATKKIHPNDEKRIIRALEVYHETGIPYSQYDVLHNQYENTTYPMAFFGFTMERAKLYEQINLRVDKMMEQGLLAEVQHLLAQGFTEHDVAMQGIGYRQLIWYLKQEIDLATAVEKIKLESRRFAKRQLTWFRRDPNIHWIAVDQYQDEEVLAQMLEVIHALKAY